MRRRLLMACMVGVVAGCSAHSPMILKNTTDVSPIGSQRYPAHTNQVLVVEGPLPAEVKYEVIGIIDVGKIWYSGADGIIGEMAQRARALGADAVINAKQWRQPSGFAWAAPHGRGEAVKLLDKDKARALSVGKWL